MGRLILWMALLTMTTLSVCAQQTETFEYTTRNDTITFASDSQKVTMYWVFKTDTSAKALICTGLSDVYKIEFDRSKPVKLLKDNSLIATITDGEVLLGDRLYTKGEGTYK